MKRCKKIKIHFKKAKPTYLDFYIKKKRTKNGRAQFCKKKRISRFRIITWDLVSSPSLSNTQSKMVNRVSAKLKEQFPTHQVFQVRGLVEGEVTTIMKGVNIEDEDEVELIPSPYSIYRREFGDGLSGDN